MLSSKPSIYDLTPVKASYILPEVNLDSSIGQNVGGGILSAQMAMERPFKVNIYIYI